MKNCSRPAAPRRSVLGGACGAGGRSEFVDRTRRANRSDRAPFDHDVHRTAGGVSRSVHDRGVPNQQAFVPDARRRRWGGALLGDGGRRAAQRKEGGGGQSHAFNVRP